MSVGTGPYDLYHFLTAEFPGWYFIMKPGLGSAQIIGVRIFGDGIYRDVGPFASSDELLEALYMLEATYELERRTPAPQRSRRAGAWR